MVEWILLLLVFIILFGIAVFVIAIRNAIIIERKRKLYSKTMKVDDMVYFTVDGNSVSGELTEIDGDKVKIIVTSDRVRIYPVGE